MAASTQRPSRAVTNALTLTEMGFSIGGDTILMRRIDSRMAIAEDGERCLASLSVLTNETLSAELLLDLVGAAAYLRDGDLALANLRLVFSRLPAIRTSADAERLAAAVGLLDGGMAPSDLMKSVGLNADTLHAIRKFDPNQPRVPAGNGRASGQWGSASSAEARVVALSASQGFLRGASPEIVGALTRFAARFSVPTAVLGALFIPTPNSGGVTEGTLPDAPDIAFKSDGPAGLLTLKTLTAGRDVTVTARNLGGVFVDVRSGQEIGRNLGGQLFLALDAVTDVLQDAHEAQEDEGTKPKAAINDDEPKLCPAPQKDTPHGSSDDAKNYEDDVHARVNPTGPIKRGLAVYFSNPQTGDSYFFDDCFRSHGDLVDGDMQQGDFADAKSARFGFLFLNDKLRPSVLAKFQSIADRQMAAAAGTGRRIKWYFGSKLAADIVRDTIGRNHDITIGYMAPRH